MCGAYCRRNPGLHPRPGGSSSDRQYRFLYLNRPATEALTKKREEVIGKSIFELFPEDWTAEFREVCERAWSEGKAVTVERRSGVLGHWVENHILPLGRALCVQWRNIGERKLAEAALRESEERYRGLFESMREAFALGEIIWDDAGNASDWRYLDVNSAFEKMFGRRRAEVVGRTYHEIFPGEWSAFWVANVGRVVATGEPAHFENYGNAGGYYEAMAYCPRPGQFAMIMMDISERKRTGEALRESERRFRELANAMPQLVWTADAGGAVTFVSRQWSKELGIPEDAARGWGWTRVLHPDDRARVEGAWRGSVESGEPFRMEVRMGAASGEYRCHLMRGVPIRDEQQHITCWYGTCTDIHDTKRAEERLRHVQKLQSVGLLAGGIAHDFNNLLTGILGHASLLAAEVKPDQAERVREVVTSAERAAHLTRQLLAYAGKGQLIVREIDVALAVNELADLAHASVPVGVELVIAAQAGLPRLRMDPGQLRPDPSRTWWSTPVRPLARAKPGKITISVSLASSVERRFTDATGEDVAPGRYIAIEVADTGSGIDAEMKEKIFDPFFTTKFTGRGLGLAAVAGIIRTQKGGLTVESVAGEGATFRVLLPAGERASAGGGGAGAECGHALLVVDDESIGARFHCRGSSQTGLSCPHRRGRQGSPGALGSGEKQDRGSGGGRGHARDGRRRSSSRQVEESAAGYQSRAHQRIQRIRGAGVCALPIRTPSFCPSRIPPGRWRRSWNRSCRSPDRRGRIFPTVSAAAPPAWSWSPIPPPPSVGDATLQGLVEFCRGVVSVSHHAGPAWVSRLKYLPKPVF